MGPYLLNVNIVFLLLVGGYAVFLRRSTWLSGRRAWLLAAALCAMTLPLLPVPLAVSEFVVVLPEVAQMAAPIGPRPTSLGGILLALHWAGSSFFLLHSVVRVLRSLQPPGHLAHAGSFFSRIHVPTLSDPLDERTVRIHEQVHARLGHSADVLLMELLAAFFWWDPAWRWALGELRLVHEHQADRVAAPGHPHYAALLVAQALGTSRHTLTHGFSRSHLTQRLHMLQRPSPPRVHRSRFLLFILIAFVALAATAWRAAPAPGTKVPLQDPVKQPEQMPVYPGGMDGLIAFLVNALDYPNSAVQEGVEGTVYTEFVVEVDGTVRDIRVKRGVHPALDAEAVRVLGTMARWEPGRNGGEPVPVSMVLPVAFRLPKGR